MNDCPECGAECLFGALFCEDCGAAIHPAARVHAGRRPGSIAGRGVAGPDRTDPAPDMARQQPGGLRVAFPGLDKTLTLRGSVIWVGRADPADDSLPELDLADYDGLELGVSRRHATIQWAGGGYVLIDQHSSNGTWLEGERLVAGYAYRIPPRANVRFGQLLVQLATAD